jgi:pyruvate dehydrogenase E2 component (dihydrolipoamide acetyltransferase)
MAETIIMPKLGFDMAEGTLVRWVKKEGETVNKGEMLAEIETDKATVEVESTASGVVRKLVVDEGAVVPVGTPIAVVGTTDEVIQEFGNKGIGNKGSGNQESGKQALENRESRIENSPKPETVSVVAEIPVVEAVTVKASPLAKRIARDRQVDLSKIKGTGPGGRIVRRDIEAALASQESLVAGQTVSTPPTPDYSTMRLSDQTLPMSKLRLAIARRTTESKTTLPHFYVTHEYKVDALLDLRKQFNAIVPENEKLSVNDFIVKAVALTLRQFPNLNASLSGTSVVRHGAVNIGVAVSVEGGLMTVVCHDADQKLLRQISTEVKAMAARARDGKVKPDDIEGSTFSISNMGMYEVENFAAIINPPEAAILAVGSAREIPVAENGAIKSGWRMKATISVDHRVSDGVEAGKFMQALAGYLEEPLRMIL